MKITLNGMTTVVLKERGVEALNHYYKELGMKPREEYQVGQKYKAPLWNIMLVFGEYCYMGTEPPFEMIFDIEVNGSTKGVA